MPTPQGGKEAPPVSRRETLEAEGIEPETPPVEWGEHLLQYLWEIGPTMPGAMGSVAVSPPWLESWQRQTGIWLQPWEFRLLRRLSGEYAAESHRASERNCPAPWQPEVYQPERILSAIEQRDAFRNLAKL